MRILNLVNLDEEMVQATISRNDGADIVVMTFATIDDLKDYLAQEMKGSYAHDYRSAAGGSHGIFSGYYRDDPRYRSRH